MRSALNKLKDNDFEEAVAEFDEVERQHPYSCMGKKIYNNVFLRKL